MIRTMLAAAVAAIGIAGVAQAAPALQTLVISPTAYANEAQYYYQNNYVFMASEIETSNGLTQGGLFVSNGVLFTPGEGDLIITHGNPSPFSLGSIDFGPKGLPAGGDGSLQVYFDYANGSSSGGFVVPPVATQQLAFNQDNLVSVDIRDYSGGVEISQLTLTDITAAPEPSTWALMMLGVGGIGLVLRRAGKRGAEAAVIA